MEVNKPLVIIVTREAWEGRSHIIIYGRGGAMQ